MLDLYPRGTTIGSAKPVFSQLDTGWSLCPEGCQYDGKEMSEYFVIPESSENLSGIYFIWTYTLISSFNSKTVQTPIQYDGKEMSEYFVIPESSENLSGIYFIWTYTLISSFNSKTVQTPIMDKIVTTLLSISF